MTSNLFRKGPHTSFPTDQWSRRLPSWSTGRFHHSIDCCGTLSPYFPAPLSPYEKSSALYCSSSFLHRQRSTPKKNPLLHHRHLLNFAPLIFLHHHLFLDFHCFLLTNRHPRSLPHPASAQNQNPSRSLHLLTGPLLADSSQKASPLLLLD